MKDWKLRKDHHLDQQPILPHQVQFIANLSRHRHPRSQQPHPRPRHPCRRQPWPPDPGSPPRPPWHPVAHRRLPPTSVRPLPRANMARTGPRLQRAPQPATQEVAVHCHCPRRINRRRHENRGTAAWQQRAGHQPTRNRLFRRNRSNNNRSSRSVRPDRPDFVPLPWRKIALRRRGPRSAAPAKTPTTRRALASG